MSPQEQANVWLHAWQTLRAMPPENRMEAIFADAFVAPAITEAELDIALNSISEEMSHV